MNVTLPIEDAVPSEGVEPELLALRPIQERGAKSLTQNILEKVMETDFPTVACLGIEVYVSRLSRIVYTDGFQVFWLDRLPELPGYTLVAMEAPTGEVGPDGFYYTRINYKTGPAAAALAEQVRRCIPPGKMHSND